MRFSAGRMAQLAGLVLVGFGLVMGLARNDLRYEERMFIAGAVVFFVGWLLLRPYRNR